VINATFSQWQASSEENRCRGRCYQHDCSGYELQWTSWAWACWQRLLLFIPRLQWI